METTPKTSYSGSLIKISDEDFHQISNLIYDKFGLHLALSKKFLVEYRLNNKLKTMGFSTFNEFYKVLLNDQSEEILSMLVDKITTNHSFFYREKYHFDFLFQKVFPDFINQFKNKNKTIFRIWSAGCASGDESYTISMLAHNYFNERYPEIKIKILATDISTKVLNTANNAVFPVSKVKDLPYDLKVKYLTEINSNQVKVNDIIKNNITFRQMNLMQEKYPFKNKFDVIFCRNVMIYFDTKSRVQVINNIFDALESGGYFIISHTEKLPSESIKKFKNCRSSIYLKR